MRFGVVPNGVYGRLWPSMALVPRYFFLAGSFFLGRPKGKPDGNGGKLQKPMFFFGVDASRRPPFSLSDQALGNQTQLCATIVAQQRKFSLGPQGLPGPPKSISVGNRYQPATTSIGSATLVGSTWFLCPGNFAFLVESFSFALRMG